MPCCCLFFQLLMVFCAPNFGGRGSFYFIVLQSPQNLDIFFLQLIVSLRNIPTAYHVLIRSPVHGFNIIRIYFLKYSQFSLCQTTLDLRIELSLENGRSLPFFKVTQICTRVVFLIKQIQHHYVGVASYLQTRHLIVHYLPTRGLSSGQSECGHHAPHASDSSVLSAGINSSIIPYLC